MTDRTEHAINYSLGDDWGEPTKNVAINVPRMLHLKKSNQ